MTVELEVIPTTQRRYSWRQICLKLGCSQHKGQRWRGELELLDAHTGRPVSEDEFLSVPHFYGIDYAGQKSLEIDFTKNEDHYIDEMIFIENFCSDSSKLNFPDVALAWKKAGYSCIISTHPRRHADEPYVVVSLAIAIAQLCDGFVVIKSNNTFSRPIGIYSATEFADVSPLFSGRR